MIIVINTKDNTISINTETANSETTENVIKDSTVTDVINYIRSLPKESTSEEKFNALWNHNKGPF